MTPCESKGWEVGDQFRVLETTQGFTKGQIVELYCDDGSECPLFKGDNARHQHADNQPGAFLLLERVEKLQAPRWTPWPGGSCPVDPSAEVKLLFRDGTRGKSWHARMYNWSNTGVSSDIVGYRVVDQRWKPGDEVWLVADEMKAEVLKVRDDLIAVLLHNDNMMWVKPHELRPYIKPGDFMYHPWGEVEVLKIKGGRAIVVYTHDDDIEWVLLSDLSLRPKP